VFGEIVNCFIRDCVESYRKLTAETEAQAVLAATGRLAVCSNDPRRASIPDSRPLLVRSEASTTSLFGIPELAAVSPKRERGPWTKAGRRPL